MTKAIAVPEDLRLDIGSDGSRRQGAEAVDLEAELGADEAARLLRAIDEADAEYERGGEGAEVEVVMQELHQILRG
jgi:hypothetical protein